MTAYLKPGDRKPRCGKPMRTGSCVRSLGHKSSCESQTAYTNKIAYAARWRVEHPEHRDALRKHARDRQAFLDEYKMERGCADCGYRKYAGALEFDHLPGSTKQASVADMYRSSMTRLLAEIEKCEVVCANCHRERTAKRRQGKR